jgi:general secretion pathway protein C
MGLDALAKRYSTVVVCLMLAVAAYFQASGVGQLVGVLLAPAEVVRGAPSSASPASSSRDPDRDTSAAAILDRNPFDSVTGPLTARTANLPQGDVAPGADPYRDPPCGVVRAVLIAASKDPEWSFAALTGPDGKTVLRRRGEEFFGGKVDFIGDLRKDDRSESGVWDRVWLTAPNGTRCQLQLGAKPPPGMASPAPPASSSAPPPGGGLPPDLMSKIRKTGEHSFDVDRSAVDALLANPAELMKTRVVPDKEGDKVVGLKLFGIKPSSLLGVLGIENGDRLAGINGFEMNDPQTMMEAYGKLLHADHLAVSVVRGGKPLNLDFSIK